jgi:hypothetical protein
MEGKTEDLTTKVQSFYNNNKEPAKNFYQSHKGLCQSVGVGIVGGIILPGSFIAWGLVTGTAYAIGRYYVTKDKQTENK